MAVGGTGMNDVMVRRSPAMEQTRWRSMALRQKMAALRLHDRQPVQDTEEGVSSGGLHKRATTVTTRLPRATKAFRQGEALRSDAVKHS
jgi:hypothetical protein